MNLHYKLLFLNILGYLYICEGYDILNAFSMEMFTYNRIKEMLAKHKKTSKALAEYLNVYEPTVSSWCTNHNQPSIAKLYKIAKFLNIEAIELLSPMHEIKKIRNKNN